MVAPGIHDTEGTMENTSQSGPSSLEDQSVPGKGMHHYVSADNAQI